MTEAEWLACEDPVRLLAHLDRPQGDRKLLLYAVACCRANWAFLIHRHSREAVEWSERLAEGRVQRDEEYERLEYMSEGAAFASEAAAGSDRFPAAVFADWCERYDATAPERLRGVTGRVGRGSRSAEADRIVSAAYFANSVMWLDNCFPYDPTLSKHHAVLSAPPLRDIFGNPFRPLAFAPEWRTDTAVALARQMYESCDFSAMPILADALQEAGCDSEDILDHCRGPGPHVRGCWAVDLVLGKE